MKRFSNRIISLLCLLSLTACYYPAYTVAPPQAYPAYGAPQAYPPAYNTPYAYPAYYAAPEYYAAPAYPTVIGGGFYVGGGGSRHWR